MLDAASLEAITLEARQCFLTEDAPDYLLLLHQGIESLRQAETEKLTPAASIYQNLIRAAHSLKGGAGIAQLPQLQQLAHRLEDLLQAMAGGKIADLSLAIELITLSLENIIQLIEVAKNGQKETGVNSREIIEIIGEFLSSIEKGQEIDKEKEQQEFTDKILLTDLEECIQQLEKNVNSDGKILKQNLQTFSEECLLLGEALKIDWLREIGKRGEKGIKLGIDLEKLARAIILEVRELRKQFLAENLGNEELKISPRLTQLIPQVKSPQQADKISINQNERNSLKINSEKAPKPELNLRIPVTRLNQMGNTVGELLISYERLLTYQQQLQQASFNLKKSKQKLKPLQEQFKSFYDQWAITDRVKLDEQAIDAPLTIKSEFDSLQLDQYGEIHKTLQKFQELIIQVAEIHEDIDLLRLDFQESLLNIKKDLNNLNQDLTESRLINFGTVAGRFFKLLDNLSQRYHKSVKLIIKGENVLIDEAILENLQTPLIHIIRNAFDHGIETPQERLRLGKIKTGIITVAATAEIQEILIFVKDNGRGIDLKKVFNKAIKLGICSQDIAFDQLSQEEILEFIFAPGFSTAAEVNELSGRGIGLDIVRSEIKKLGGNLKVETIANQGTTFILNIPQGLNTLPLLLFRYQEKLFGIPSVNIKSVIALKEYTVEDSNNNSSIKNIFWQDKRLLLLSVSQLLNYNQPYIFDYGLDISLSKFALILKIKNTLVAVAIDEIIVERELVVKPLDSTVKYPNYLAGCTVLGTGELVPIIAPNYWHNLISILLKKEIVITEKKLTEANVQASVLIVDDSVAVRRSLDRILTHTGYQVLQCRNGQEAWKTLNSSNRVFDLVISDIEMPELDGFSLLKMIRSQNEFKELPLVMLTSRASEIHRQKAKSLGATAYFTKPFQPAQFLVSIQEIIASFRQN